MRVIRLCTKYFARCKAELIVFSVVSLVGSLVSIFTPYILGSFIDILVKGKGYGHVMRYVIAFAGLSMFLIIKDYVVSVLGVRIRMKTAYEFNMDAACNNDYYKYEDINNTMLFCCSIFYGVFPYEEKGICPWANAKRKVFKSLGSIVRTVKVCNSY